MVFVLPLSLSGMLERQEKKQQEKTTTSRIHQKRSTCLKNSVEGKNANSLLAYYCGLAAFVEPGKTHFDGAKPSSRYLLPRKRRLVPCPKYNEISD